VSERRRYLISYDVSDDKRRDRLATLLEGHGDRVQFSVFFADLTDRELIVLRTKAREVIHEGDDQVLFVDLGREDRPAEETLEVLGKPYRPATRTTIV
jgi:CRISPR-associated protein Cas2